MAEMTKFELVSPEKLLKSEDVEMVVVPGVEGDFGVLAEHSPMLSTIRPGVINVYAKGEIVDSIFVAGGFADVNETSVTVLAEEAVPVTELTSEGVEARLQAAKDSLAEADDDLARAKAESEVAVATAQQEALSA